MKNGLLPERKAGTNPYKSGMIGSTHSHSSVSTAEEENDVAKEPPCGPGADRTATRRAIRSLDTDLGLVVTTGGLLPGGTRSLSASESWWVPVIGIRGIAPLTECWTFVGVGSDLTWQAVAGVYWQFAPSFVAKFGYRYFYQDCEDNGFVWDMAAHGFYPGWGCVSRTCLKIPCFGSRRVRPTHQRLHSRHEARIGAQGAPYQL